MQHKLRYLTIKKILFPNAEVIVGGEEGEVFPKKKRKEKVYCCWW
jgi:hypothetical protein